MQNKPLLFIVLMFFFVWSVRAQEYNILSFGAVADGKTINTKAIQAAIDQAAGQGGKVIVPRGVFLSGTLYLKNGTNMVIQKNAVLKGSPFFKDYPDNQVNYQNAFTHEGGVSKSNKAFLFAENVNGITLSGEGTIDGNGDSKEFQLGNDDTPQSRLRPCMLLIIDSKKIALNGLNLTNSAYWVQNYLGCDGLNLSGLNIYAHSNYNQDAMDIDAKNVLVENCRIDVDDDGICFKSHDGNRSVEHVVVRNCDVGTNCNAIKFGTLSIGAFKNFKISGINIHKASADHIRQWQKNLKFIGLPTTVISGIALESVDGALIDNIDISDVTMKDVQTPIFIVLGNRGRSQAAGKGFYDVSTASAVKTGGISNVSISNVRAISYSKMSSSITAYPGQYITDVVLRNISFDDMGGGTPQESNLQLMENSRAYPENRMYGLVYPASGLFVRHVKGIELKNLMLKVRSSDYRSSIVYDDVVDSKISFVNLTGPEGQNAAITLVNCKSIKINQPKFNTKSSPLIKLRGTAKKEISIRGLKKS
jgi:polygalacturonase